MHFKKLEQNVIDVIKEEQIKLGYRREVIRLYYPLQSVNTLMGTTMTSDEMKHCLSDIFDKEQSVLGSVAVSCQADRFCLMIPESGVEYVHMHTKDNEFIIEFIDVIQKHDVTIEQILEVFHKHSQKVHFEKVNHGEFDYMIYFEDGNPDDYRYCITDEGCHMIYHRFTPDDYQDYEF